jgi:hypothetical protein
MTMPLFRTLSFIFKMLIKYLFKKDSIYCTMFRYELMERNIFIYEKK